MAANEKSMAAFKPHQWQKGQSGNPGGVTKSVREVRDMLKKLHPDCEKALRGIIENWETDRRAAVQAIQVVYARSIGKERENLFTPKDRAALGAAAADLKNLPDEALDEIETVLRKYAT